jgi:hypothetical protein
MIKEPEYHLTTHLKVFITSALFLSFLSNGLCQQPVQSRPNIIVFMVDDMGWMDTSVPFYDSMDILVHTDPSFRGLKKVEFSVINNAVSAVPADIDPLDSGKGS